MLERLYHYTGKDGRDALHGGCIATQKGLAVHALERFSLI